MSTNPYESPLTEGQPPVRKARSIMSTLLSVLVVTGIIGVLVALLLPASRGSREASRRMHCYNNLKQIGIALHNYADEYGALPPAYTVDDEGRPLHSWRTLILPYLGEEALYEKIDLSKPWSDPANKAAFDTPLRVYHCPSVNCPPTDTTYLAIVVPGGCFRKTEPRRLAEISDSHNLTLLVMEVDAKRSIHWMTHFDAAEPMIAKLGTKDNLPHRSGSQVLSVDGTVRFLSTETSPEIIRALVTVDGDDDAIARQD
jgi:type II secretory pathway pseudopilin PulG